MTEGVSCASCPAFVGADATMSKLGVNFGAAVCGRHLTALGSPTMSEVGIAELQRQTASTCPQYGQAVPVKLTVRPAILVSLPDADVMSELAGLDDDDRKNNAPRAGCNECKWFTNAEVTRETFGWPAPFCRAKGSLLPSNNLVNVARSCGQGYRVSAYQSKAAEPLNVQLLPNISQGFYVSVHGLPTDVAAVSKHVATDPRDWVTDKPLSAYDRSIGTRAWRAVEDPEGLRPTKYLPIFEGEKLVGFDPRSTYGRHTPQLYLDHQNLLYDFVCMSTGDLVEGAKKKTTILIGGAGTGKTEFGCYLAWLMDLPFIRITLHNNSEVGDLIGETGLVNGETKFVMGRFMEWYGKPCVLMVDEPNAAPEQVWQLMRPAFDAARELFIEQAGGISVKKYPACLPILSMNPSWDPAYTGLNQISLADFDRACFVETILPPEDVEMEIIRKHCLEEGYEIQQATLDTIMKIAGDLRGMIREGALMLAWNIRPQVKVAELTDVFSFEKAYRRAVCDGLEPAQAELIMQVVRNYTS